MNDFGYLKGEKDRFIKIIMSQLHYFTHRPGFVERGVFYGCLVLELQSAK